MDFSTDITTAGFGVGNLKFPTSPLELVFFVPLLELLLRRRGHAVILLL